MQNYMTIQDMQYENFFPNKTKGVNVFSFILAKSINFHLEINHFVNVVVHLLINN